MNWWRLNTEAVAYRFLHCDLVCKFLEWISSLKFAKFVWSVLLEELVDREVATSDFNLDFATLDPYHDSLLSKLINARWFAHKHDFHLLMVKIVNIFG